LNRRGPQEAAGRTMFMVGGGAQKRLEGRAGDYPPRDQRRL